LRLAREEIEMDEGIVAGGDEVRRLPPLGGALLEEGIVERLQRIAKSLKDTACGPLVVAREVVRLAEEWEEYRGELPKNDQKLSASSVFKKYLGFDLGYFERRARAVELLGEDVRRWMHHECAIWIVSVVPGVQLQEAKEKLLGNDGIRRRKKQRTAVTQAQAEPIVQEFIGHIPAPRACEECQRLRGMLIALGVDPDE
jgi:hypothetical protein